MGIFTIYCGDWRWFKSSWWFQTCVLFNIIFWWWRISTYTFQVGGWSTNNLFKSYFGQIFFSAIRPLPNGFPCNKLLQVWWFLKNFDIWDQRQWFLMISQKLFICPNAQQFWHKRPAAGSSKNSRCLLHLQIGRSQHDSHACEWYMMRYGYVSKPWYPLVNLKIAGKCSSP